MDVGFERSAVTRGIPFMTKNRFLSSVCRAYNTVSYISIGIGCIGPNLTLDPPGDLQMSYKCRVPF